MRNFVIDIFIQKKERIENFSIDTNRLPWNFEKEKQKYCL
jgi:hypothetical protein